MGKRERRLRVCRWSDNTPSTAKVFVFITMKDEDGLMNIIVRPDVYQRYYKVLRKCFLLIAEGTV